MKDTCKWVFRNECIYEHWKTECSNAFYFIDDGPKENNFKYCPYCGRKLIVEPQEGK